MVSETAGHGTGEFTGSFRGVTANDVLDRPGDAGGVGSRYPEASADIGLDRLLKGLGGTHICVFYQDVELIYRWIENPPAGFDADVVGLTDHDLPATETGHEMIEAKRRCLETGERGQTAVCLLLGGHKRWFDLWVEPDRDANEAIVGLLGFAIEVTERVEREERLRVLLREVSHRSRNLLAIVQSIAAQTVRTAAAPSRFLERFNERLQSLAHTLDIVTVRDWDGATVHQLVSRQAGPFVPATGVIEMAGPDPILTPNAALHLGLAVQELGSNAAHHGAWSAGDGMVYARTRYEDDDLVFEWTEAGAEGAEPVQLDKRGSFGSRTLTAIVPAAVNGQASMRREGVDFVYRLKMPPANFVV